METERPTRAYQSIDRRQLVYLALLGIAVFLFLPHVVGFDRVWRHLRGANPLYLFIALAAEASRYFVSAGSTIALARLFHRRVPVAPMTQAFFAGAALNRIFSTGGAPGMILRLMFLVKHQVHAGGVAAIFLIEDLIGLVIGASVLFIGIVALNTQAAALFQLAVGFLVGSTIFFVGSIHIFRHRQTIEWLVHGIARTFNHIAERFFRRTIYLPDRIQAALDDFYTGLRAARRQPAMVAASVGFNLLRYVGGGAAMYFSFLAVGYVIAPSTLIMLYTFATVISTTSAVPGEAAVMSGGLAILLSTLGIAPDVAVVALILARAIAFWLPMPVGLLALAHLRRHHDL